MAALLRTAQRLRGVSTAGRSLVASRPASLDQFRLSSNLSSNLFPSSIRSSGPNPSLSGTQPRRGFFDWARRQLGLQPKLSSFRGQIGTQAKEEAERLFAQANKINLKSREDLLKINGILTAALEADPGHIPAATLLGHTKHVLGDLQGSIAVLKNTLTQKPFATKLAYHLAAAKSELAMSTLKKLSLPDRHGTLRVAVQKKELTLVLDAVTEFHHTIMLADASNDLTTLLAALAKYSLWSSTLQSGNAFTAAVLLRALYLLERGIKEPASQGTVASLMGKFTDATSGGIDTKPSAARMIGWRVVDHFKQYLQTMGDTVENEVLREQDEFLLNELDDLLSKIEADPLALNSVSSATLSEIRRILQAGPYLEREEGKRPTLAVAEATVYQAVGVFASEMISVPTVNAMIFPKLEPLKGLSREIAELGELAFSRAIETDPHTKVYKELVALRLSLGKLEEALALVEKAPKKMMSREDRDGTVVWCYMAANQMQKAEEFIQKVVEEFPEAVVPHLIFARLSLHEEFENDPKRGSERALHHAQRAFEILSSAQTKQFLRAVQTTLDRRERGESSDDLWKTVEPLRQEGLVMKMVARAHRLRERGMVYAALDVLEEAVQRYPEVAPPYMHLARIRLQAAEDKFVKAFEAVGQNPDAMETARKERLEQTQLALEDVQKYVELKPEDAPGHQTLANLYFQLGKDKDAMKHCNLAVGSPNATISEFFQSADVLANIALKQQDTEALESAVQRLKQVLLMNMDYFPAHVRLAMYQGCLGNLKDAQHHLDRAQELAEEDADRDKIVRATEARLKTLVEAHKQMKPE